MSFQLLKPILDKLDVEELFFYEGSFEFNHKEYNTDVSEMLSSGGVIGVECVAHHGGEGQGDEYWTVHRFDFVDSHVYVRFEGWYASYHGSEYERFEEVIPKEVTVIEYHNV